MDAPGTAVVVGAGPGIGASVARRFGRLGPPEVLCVSPLPDVALIRPVLETSAEDLREALDLGVVGTAAAVRAVLPAMRRRGRGTLL